MEESRLIQARRLVLRLGTKRFGNADANVETTVNNLTDLEKLEQLIERVLDVHSWQELLQKT